MAWPSFDNKAAMLPQILKLEDSFREYERISGTVPSELKFAVLMKCITGNLKTFLQVTLSDSTTYEQLREEILRYDAATIRWNSNMALGTMLPGHEDTGGPMDVDRISKGKSGEKGKSKGKYDNKRGKGKGDGKGKVKSYDSYGKGKTGDGKGKQQNSWNTSSWNTYSKGDNKGWYKGKQQSKGDGKGAKAFSKGKSKPTCHKCGAVGHFARDCQVRAVSDQQNGVQSNVGSNYNSAVTNVTGSSASNSQPVSRVSRVSADRHVSFRRILFLIFLDLVIFKT